VTRFAIADPRGLCPAGFRIPTDADWNALEAFLGRAEAAYGLKARSGWPAPAKVVQEVAMMMSALAASPQDFAPSAARSFWAGAWLISGR
jgi:uncharacterized protein (TIGR02145 family)